MSSHYQDAACCCVFHDRVKASSVTLKTRRNWKLGARWRAEPETDAYAYLGVASCSRAAHYLITTSWRCPATRTPADTMGRGSRAIYTHTPARKSSTNFQLYCFVIQICSTSWLGHGRGYKWHSSTMGRGKGGRGLGLSTLKPYYHNNYTDYTFQRNNTIHTYDNRRTFAFPNGSLAVEVLDSTYRSCPAYPLTYRLDISIDISSTYRALLILDSTYRSTYRAYEGGPDPGLLILSNPQSPPSSDESKTAFSCCCVGLRLVHTSVERVAFHHYWNHSWLLLRNIFKYFSTNEWEEGIFFALQDL